VAVTGEEDFACLGYIECLRYCLEQRGERRSKTWLMGISGETFRLCYDRNDPERGVEVVFHNPIRAACAALGYGCEVVYHRALGAAMEGLRRHLGEGGLPILHTAEDWVVIRADGSDPQRVVARCPDGRCQAWALPHLERIWLKQPGLLELGLRGYYWLALGKKEREPDEREAAMGSLRRGVRMLQRKSRIDDCAAGLAAYQEIMDSLLRKQRNEVQQAHAVRKYTSWSARPLTYARDSRRAGAQYLGLLEPHFDEETNEHLRKAADSCREAAQALAEVPVLEVPVIDPQGELGRAERKAMRTFASLRPRAERRVRRAQHAEEEALREIHRALEAAEKKDKDVV